jgi:hypothetical protein
LYINNLYTITPTLPAADFRAVLEPKNVVGSGLAGEFGSRPLSCEFVMQYQINISSSDESVIYVQTRPPTRGDRLRTAGPAGSLQRPFASRRSRCLCCFCRKLSATGIACATEILEFAPRGGRKEQRITAGASAPAPL